MSAENFFVSETNPNDGIGGGGCLCSPTKVPDAKGPFIIFTATETDNNMSPHAVLCASCVGGCAKALGGEALAAGEKDTHGVEVPIRVLETAADGTGSAADAWSRALEAESPTTPEFDLTECAKPLESTPLADDYVPEL